MTLWDSLTPWRDALSPFSNARVREHNPDSCVRGIDSIDIRLPVRTRCFDRLVTQVRQAVELLGRGLRVDPSLWVAIRLQPQTSQPTRQKYVTPCAFRDEGLVPAFTFVWDDRSDGSAFSLWLNAVSSVLSVSDLQESDAFTRARRELLQMDVFSVAQPGEYRVPVSLRVMLWDSSFSDAFVAFIVRTSASWSPAFRLTHVDLDVALLDKSVSTSLLVQLETLGVMVRTVSAQHAMVGRGVAIDSLRLLSKTREPIANELCRALVCGPVEIHAEMHPSESLDWLLLLRAASCRSSLRHLKLHLPNLTRLSLAGLNTAIRVANSGPSIEFIQVHTQIPEGLRLTKTLAERGISSNKAAVFPAVLGTDSVLLILPGGEFLAAPRSSVALVDQEVAEAAIVSLDDAQQANGPIIVDLSGGLCPPEGVPTLITLLDTCFGHRLTTLSIHIVSGVVFTGEFIASILAAFPSLLCLKLSHTQLTTMDVFLDAYRAHHCRIRVLSVDSGCVGFIPFLEELSARNSVVTRTLQELKLGCPQGETEEEDAYLSAVETMLEKNTRLQFLEIAVTNASSTVIGKVAWKLRRFHRVPLAVACRQQTPLRAKLAFIGAVTVVPASSIHGVSLDSVLVAMVLAFAAPCLLRIVQFNSQTSRGVKVSKIRRGTRYSESVDSELIDLA